MITNGLLEFCLEKEYPEAKAWRNFWVGYKSSGVSNEVQTHNSEILQWDLLIDEPTTDIIEEIVERHKKLFRDPSPESVRGTRNEFLIALDRVVSNPLRFASLTEDRKTVLGVYRQELLDVPQQKGFPENVIWPEKPVEVE